MVPSIIQLAVVTVCEAFDEEGYGNVKHPRRGPRECIYKFKLKGHKTNSTIFKLLGSSATRLKLHCELSREVLAMEVQTNRQKLPFTNHITILDVL